MFGRNKSYDGSRLIVSSDVLSKDGSRPVNEDYQGIYVKDGRIIFILCDGLGGHGKGDIASRLVVETMGDFMAHGKTIEEGIQFAQDALMAKQIELDATDSMKTTVTCLTIEKNIAKYGHVGDSRIYYFENGKFRQRSMDHSVPQMLANRGDIKEADIRFHEDRSKLIRVMGIPWNGPKYQVSDEISITPRSSFLLASDGFWELITEKDMMKTLKSAQSPKDWLLAMEKIILENGKGKNMDNYTAIAVFVRERK